MKEENKYISAGKFSSWLNRFLKSQLANKSVEVPCGDCRACCTSSYFIHIKPHEKETLLRIPKELLFDAPGLPSGHVLLGYDKNGFCPMFKNNNCSIYEFRPQTCREFDCRVFPITGISEQSSKPKIIEQSNRWQFEFNSDRDTEIISVIKNCARFILENKDYFPEGFIPLNPIQQAALVLMVYEVFIPDSNTVDSILNKTQIQKLINDIVNKYKTS